MSDYDYACYRGAHVGGLKMNGKVMVMVLDLARDLASVG